MQIVRQTLKLIDRSVRGWLAVFALISVIASLLESVGLALIFLLFKIVVRPETIEKIHALAALRQASGIRDDRLFLAALCGLLFLTLFIKILLQLGGMWLRLGIEWRIRNRVSQRLFNGYLNGPYAQVSRRSTGEIVNTVWTGVGQVSMAAIGLADLVSDAMLVIAINATLLVMQPALTAAAILLFGLASLLYLALGRRHFHRWGHKSKEAGERLFAAVTEPLAGAKQIKTLGAEAFFGARFRDQIVELSRFTRRNSFVSQSLKPLLELLVIAGLLGPIAFLLIRGMPLVDIVPILALFGTAAYRLLPSFVRMSNLLQTFQYARPMLMLVQADLDRFAVLPAAPRSAVPNEFREEIRLERVSFTFEGTAEPVLSDINLVVRRGQSVALVGPSGAGKTTLVDIILGLLSPSTGRVLIDGEPAGPGCRPHLFGYVPQESFLINDTIRRNIALGAARIDEARLRRAVEAASLGEFITALPQGLDTVVGERGLRLSGGQRQRLAIARALYNRTDVLILDESTSALDSTTEAAVSEAIHRLKETQTLIIIAHRLSTVRNCDRLFFMQGGRIVDQGSFAELLARNAAFRAMVREMELVAPAAGAIRTAG